MSPIIACHIAQQRTYSQQAPFMMCIDWHMLEMVASINLRACGLDYVRELLYFTAVL